MSTVAASPRLTPHPPASAGRHDRKFYSGIAIAMALAVVIGFGPTYYLRSPAVTITGAAATPVVHAHAAAFTAWVLLFIVQTALVATHRVQVHRKLGIAGGVLAVAMIVFGLNIAITGAARGVAPPGIGPLEFLAIPFFDMVAFAALVGAALWYRRNKEAHKRLMLVAYVALMAAPMARFPGVLPLGPLAFYGLAFIFLFAGVIYDWVSRRRVHPAYVWGGGLLVLSVPLRLALSGTAAWKSFAEFLIR